MSNRMAWILVGATLLLTAGTICFLLLVDASKKDTARVELAGAEKPPLTGKRLEYLSKSALGLTAGPVPGISAKGHQACMEMLKDFGVGKYFSCQLPRRTLVLSPQDFFGTSAEEVFEVTPEEWAPALRTRYVPAGTTVYLFSINNMDGQPWYGGIVVSESPTIVAFGWIDSTALIGTEVQRGTADSASSAHSKP